MEYVFRFAHPFVLVGALTVTCLVLWFRYIFTVTPTYRYSLVQALKKHLKSQPFTGKTILNAIRFLSLILMACLLARPQFVDPDAHIHVEGIDIMLVLDLSGSMRFFDDLQDRRPRIEVAKQEAIHFINKREHDPMGLIIFGRDAISRCPLTLDKSMLKGIVKDLKIGVVDPRGTVLSTSLALAVNRLKSSKAKSKVIVLLTDGEPSEYDIKPQIALDLAKKYGIKVYTIGIGSDRGGYINQGIFGVQRLGAHLNKRLLYHIAQQTGGKFYEAKKPKDLKKIYDNIDRLEKTEYDENVFTKYYDILLPLLWVIIGLCVVELILSSFVWFSL